MRHGTTSLFAAFVDQRPVMGQTQRRHRSLEFRNFLDTIEENVPPELDVHLILDNYGTHKTQLIRAGWQKDRASICTSRPPRPVGSTWSNAGSPTLTEKQIRRGVHRTTIELETAIRRFIEHHNKNPKPFVWHKTADQILDSVARFCKRTLDSGH